MYKYLITVVSGKISTLPVTNEDFTKEKSFEIDEDSYLYIGYYYTPETQHNRDDADEDDEEEEYYDEFKLYLPIGINQVIHYIDTDILLDKFDKEPLSVHVEDRRICLTGLLAEPSTSF